MFWKMRKKPLPLAEDELLQGERATLGALLLQFRLQETKSRGRKVFIRHQFRHQVGQWDHVNW